MIDALYRMLAKLGFSDPLHPPIVHIPIGLVIGAFVFFAVALLFKRKQLVLTARHVSILALLFAFPSIFFGFLDWIHFYHGILSRTIQIKMGLAAALLILLTLGIILGGKAKPLNAVMLFIYTCSFLAVVALGYFGASLINYPARFAAASSQGAASTASAGLDAGKTLFEANCQACHAGGGNSIVAALPIKGSKRLAGIAGFEAFVRAPTMPNGKSGDMPPYGTDALATAQVKDLYAYLLAAFKR
jgi:mono/diheme cytochrome c family protein